MLILLAVCLPESQHQYCLRLTQHRQHDTSSHIHVRQGFQRQLPRDSSLARGAWSPITYTSSDVMAHCTRGQ
ncbi:hypothetical protein WJX74_004696 [Apatococcus lobatus]|uniref:Secreted protein n=2 Tax=Apatococcus TaxID=904362 RepID=A0AAW1SSU3_9CHLO